MASMLWVSVLVALAAFIYARYLGTRLGRALAYPSQLQAVIEVWLVLVAGLDLTYVHGHNTVFEIAWQGFLVGLGALALTRDRAKRVVTGRNERGETIRHAAGKLADRLALRGLVVLCRLIAAGHRADRM